MRNVVRCGMGSEERRVGKEQQSLIRVQYSELDSRHSILTQTCRVRVELALRMIPPVERCA